MEELKYVEAIREIIAEFDPHGSNRYFIFGSSLRSDHFHDIDLGVVGNRHSGRRLTQLRDRFYDSNIPYKIDIVDFDEADGSFSDYVLSHEPLVWIR